MDDALGMYEYLDLRGIHIEEPFGLDHFQAFVDQGGRVDGDLGTHSPGGMAQGVLRRHILEVRRFFASEGAA